MLPLLVAAQIGSVANAYFYSAWVVGSAFEYVLSSIAVSVVVAGANRDGSIGWVARRGAALAGAILLPAIGLTLLLAPDALNILGHGYAAKGTVVLRYVAVAVAPRAVVSLSVATARIERNVRAMVVIQVAGCVLTLGLASALLPRLGVAGAGLGYLVGQSLVALALIPRLVRMVRAPSPALGPRRRHLDVARAGQTIPPPTATPPGGRGHRGRFPTGWSERWRPLPLGPLAAAAALADALFVGAGWHIPGQPLLAIAVLAWVPGAALVGLFGIEDHLLAAVLALATSVALETLCGETMMWLGLWHPRAAITVGMAVAAAVLLALWVIPRRRSAPT